MILDRLMKICNEIRFMEASYEMPPHVNFEKELTARALCDKQAREEAIAKQLYVWIKEYALQHMDKQHYQDLTS
jgi:hypothetical protein